MSLSIPPNPFPSTHLGTVLVIGGTGTLGSAIAHHLLTSPFHSTSSTVHVLCRNPPSPRIAAFISGAIYHHMSIKDESSLRALLAEIKPSVIFHTFSPKFTSPAALLYEMNVVGTSILLKCATEAQSVKALVYSSSDSVMEVLQLDNGEKTLTEETCRVIDPSDTRQFDPYRCTKTIADGLVAGANSPNLKTARLRFGTMYGDGDTQNLPLYLGMLKQGQPKVQIGPNTTPRELIYVPSNAYAHVLAAQALLNGKGLDGGKVDGEVFFISDKEGGEGAMLFWDFARLIWQAAGDQTPMTEVSVVPIWLVKWGMTVQEWVYWIATLGMKKPDVTWQVAAYMFMPIRLDIAKAVKRLGFTPLLGVEEGVRRGVEWMVKEGWKLD